VSRTFFNSLAVALVGVVVMTPRGIRAQDYSIRQVYQLDERRSAQPQYTGLIPVTQAQLPLSALCPNGQCGALTVGTVVLPPGASQPLMQRGPTLLDFSRTRVVYRTRR
jgi:hypothetical protein